MRGRVGWSLTSSEGLEVAECPCCRMVATEVAVAVDDMAWANVHESAEKME